MAGGDNCLHILAVEGVIEWLVLYANLVDGGLVAENAPEHQLKLGLNLF